MLVIDNGIVVFQPLRKLDIEVDAHKPRTEIRAIIILTQHDSLFPLHRRSQTSKQRLPSKSDKVLKLGKLRRNYRKQARRRGGEMLKNNLKILTQIPMTPCTKATPSFLGAYF